MKNFGFIFLLILLFFFGCSSESVPQYESYSSIGDAGTVYYRTYTTLSECDKSIDLGKTDWVVRYSDISYLGEFSQYYIYSGFPEFAGKREHVFQIFEFKNIHDEPYSLHLKHEFDHDDSIDADSIWGGMRAKTHPMPQMDNFMRLSDGMESHRGYYYRGMIYTYGTSGYLLSITWNTGRSICVFRLFDQGYYGFEYDLSDENSIIAQIVDPARAEKAISRMTNAILAPYYRSIFLKWLPVIMIVLGVGTISIVYYTKRKKHLNHIRQIMKQASNTKADG